MYMCIYKYVYVYTHTYIHMNTSIGDEMGLGKTCQTVIYLAGAMARGLIKRVLIVAPVSVLAVWSREFVKFCPDLSVREGEVSEQGRMRRVVCVCARARACVYIICVCACVSKKKWNSQKKPTNQNLQTMYSCLPKSACTECCECV